MFSGVTSTMMVRDSFSLKLSELNFELLDFNLAYHSPSPRIGIWRSTPIRTGVLHQRLALAMPRIDSVHGQLPRQ
jgi:hypothetical protein